MNKAKRKKLEQRGWKVGSTSEFLGLTTTKWVGLRNYRDLYHDTFFRNSIWVTIKFTLITVSMFWSIWNQR